MDREIRRRILALWAEDRRGIDSLGARVAEIWGNTERLTEEARRADVGLVLGQEGTRIRTLLSEDARRILRGGYAVVDTDLDRITATTDEELATADRALRPALNSSFERPEVLPRLLREWHRDHARRRLIEDTADVVIVGLGGEAGGRLRQELGNLRLELAASGGPEEMEANSVRSELDELGEFLDAAETVTAIDLALMNPAVQTSSDELERLQISRSIAEAVVNAYHNKYPSGLAA